jgi:hypothetical protein
MEIKRKIVNKLIIKIEKVAAWTIINGKEMPV